MTKEELLKEIQEIKNKADYYGTYYDWDSSTHKEVLYESLERICNVLKEVLMR